MRQSRGAGEPVRHGRQRTASRWGLLVRTVAMGLSVLTVASFTVAAYAYTSITSQIDEAAVDIGGASPPPPPPFLGAIEGGFTMLVVGTDNDDDQGDAYGDRGSAALNDVNILVHVAADHQNAVVVSFPRDLVIPQPECDESDAVSALQVNDAWERGGGQDGNGLGCVAATIRQLTGLDIQYAAATSFNGVIEMTNAVGGVEVCLTEPVFDENSGLDLPAGRTVVKGADALAFLRTRKTIGDGSDLARIGSQQQYLSSLLRTIRSADTLSDPTKVYGLAQAVAGNIVPSTTLRGPDTLVSLALALKDVDLAKVVFVSYPVTAYDLDPNKVQPIPDLADQLFANVAADRPFTLGEDSAATGSTVTDPAVTPAPPAETAAPDPGAAVPTDSPATPEVIEGLKGQTAAEQTCTSANHD